MAKFNSINNYSEQLAMGLDGEGTTDVNNACVLHTDQNAGTAIGCFNRHNTVAETTVEARISCHAKLNSDNSLTEGGFVLGNDLSDLTLSVGTTAQNRLCVFANAKTDGITLFAVNTTTGSLDFRTGDGATTEGRQVANCTNPGQWTYPKQPCFSVTPSANLLDVTGDGTTYTVVFATEIFDQGGNFDGTSTFTAPVTGRYIFTVSIIYFQLVAAHSLGAIFMETSNRSYNFTTNSGAQRTSDDFDTMAMTQICDMDSGDTCTIKFRVSNSTKVVDIAGSASQGFSYFSGKLIA